MAENFSKGLTFYNEWFISAIKSSKIEGELQEKKLGENCINCNNRVQLLMESNEEQPLIKYEEFRLNSTILLLLACPSLNSCPEISSSEDLIPIIKSLPPIEVDKLFVVIKKLKNYRHLRGILPWLPAKVLAPLLLTFLNLTKSMTPFVLAISYEIFFGLIYSLQYEGEVAETVTDCLETFITFLKLVKVGFDSEQNSKLRAYHFMYIVEALHLLVCLLCNEEIEEPCTASLGIKFKNLRSSVEKKMSPKFDSTVKNATCTLLSVCNEIITLVTSNIWISWHSIKSPTFGLLLFSPVAEKEQDNSGKSIQLQVAHTAYKILKTSSKAESQEDALDLSLYKELNIFFNHIAVDPNYDPDVDLSNLELIETMRNVDDAKRGKLFMILTGRDDIFSSEDCLKCAEQYGGELPKPLIAPLTEKLIDKLLCNNEVLEGWKRVVLELSRKIATEEMLNIIKVKLNNGKVECLKTAEFLADVTQIFNQLSDHSDKFNKYCDSYVWLCLQSGVDVVKYTIEMALSLPGLVHVVAPGLRTIHFICRSKIDEDISLMTKLLIEKFDTNLAPETENEFLLLILKLLEEPDVELNLEQSECSIKDVIPVDVSEMCKNIIFPRLKWIEQQNSSLLLPLNILKSIVELYPEVVLMSEAHLPSMIVSLSLIHHNCSVLTDTNFSLNLKLRSSVQCILQRVMEQIQRNKDDYGKEISAVKMALSEYELHPRCLVLLSPLINAINNEDASPFDEIFSLVLKKPVLGNEDVIIPKCSRIEWIWGMYMILPDCDDEEWLASIHLSYRYLNTNVGDTSLVMPTLKVFQEIFLLLCDSVSRSTKGNDNGGLRPLRHCFKCFTSSAMNFINEKLREDERKFLTLISIFSWWCVSQKIFDCDPELPCLFLNSLCSAMNDLIKSKTVIIKTKGKNGKALPKTLTPLNEKSEARPSEATGIEASGSNSNDSIIDGGDVNGSNNNDSNDSNESSNTFQPKQKPKREIITREKFEDSLEALVRAFVTSVSPNKVASTIAGKLKTLCEF